MNVPYRTTPQTQPFGFERTTNRSRAIVAVIDLACASALGARSTHASGLKIILTHGAESYDSDYLHIITCYSELQALKRLIGEDAAYVTIRSIALDHYRAIYALVLANEASIGRVVHDHHLLPNE